MSSHNTPDIDMPEEGYAEWLAERAAEQKRWAGDFFFRYISRVQSRFGSATASRFTSWWKVYAPVLDTRSDSRRAYTAAAMERCEDWLERDARNQEVLRASKPPAPKDEVETLSEKWGVKQKASRLFDDDEVELISKAISQGARRSIKFDTDQRRGDAQQDAWVRLLSNENFDHRQANLEGRNAGRDFNRKIEKDGLVLLSQMGDGTKPVEIDSLIKSEGGNTPDAAKVDKMHDDESYQHRRRILLQFKYERPADYQFISEFVERMGSSFCMKESSLARSTRSTGEERRRAYDIISRLQRLEATETSS